MKSLEQKKNSILEKFFSEINKRIVWKMIARDTMYIALFRELLRYRGITVKNGHEAHSLGRPRAPCLSNPWYTRIRRRRVTSERTNEPTRGNKESVRALNTRAGRVHALTSTSRRLTILSRRRGSLPPSSVAVSGNDS